MEDTMNKHDVAKVLFREVLPPRRERVQRILRRCLIAIMGSTAIMVVAHLWVHQVATRRELVIAVPTPELVISVPTPVPWMCENEHHVWQRCWWVDPISNTSAAPSAGADLVQHANRMR
jgi:hypothetical protein